MTNNDRFAFRSGMLMSVFAALLAWTAGAVEVTTLADDGEGSLRWAVERTSARVVTFADSAFAGKARRSLYLDSPIGVRNGRTVVVRGPTNHVLTITTDAGMLHHDPKVTDNRHFIVGTYSSLTLENLTLSNGCQTDPDGNLAEGGSITVDSGSLVALNCAFRANRSDFGGAVLLRNGARAYFGETSFQDNIAPLGGAAVALTTCFEAKWSEAAFDNCTFVGNRAERASGGAIRSCDATRVDISRCTFYGNVAMNGGAIYFNARSNCRGGASRLIDTVAVGSVSTVGREGCDVLLGAWVTGNGNWLGGVETVGWNRDALEFVPNKTVAETFTTAEPVPVGGCTHRMVMSLRGDVRGAGDASVPLEYEVLRANGTYCGLYEAVKRQHDDTLTLLRDVTIPSGELPTFCGEVVLDGGGHTLTLSPQDKLKTCTVLSVGMGSLTLTNITIRLEGDERTCLFNVNVGAALTVASGVAFVDFTILDGCLSPYLFDLMRDSTLTIRKGAAFRHIYGAQGLSTTLGETVVEEGVIFDDCSFVYPPKVPEPEPPVAAADPVAAAWSNLAAEVSVRLAERGLAGGLTNELSRLFEDVARTNATAVAADRLVASSNLVLAVVDYLSLPFWREGAYYTSLAEACADGDVSTVVRVLRPFTNEVTFVESSGVTLSGRALAFTSASEQALAAFPASEREGIAAAVFSRLPAVTEHESLPQGEAFVPADVVGFESASENAFTLRELRISTVGGGVRTAPLVQVDDNKRFTSYKLVIEGEVSDGAPLVNVKSNATAVLSDVFITGCTNRTAEIGAVNVAKDGKLWVLGLTTIADTLAADRPCNVKLADTARVWLDGMALTGRIGISGAVEPGMEFGRYHFESGRPDAAFVNDAYTNLSAVVDGESLQWRCEQRPEDWVALGCFPAVGTNETLELNGEGRRMTAALATVDEIDGSIPMLTVPTGAVVRISDLVLDAADSGWKSFFSVEPGGELILSNVTVRGFAGGQRAPMTCRGGRLRFDDCTFSGFVCSDSDLLDFVSYNGGEEVEIADSVFSNNVCRAIVYSSNGSGRPDAHCFVNTKFADNRCEYDFILAYGATCVDGTRMDHALKTLVVETEKVADGQPLPDPRYVFTNGVPVSGIHLDVRDLEGVDGQCVVGNERNCALLPEKVSFAVTSVVCTVTSDAGGSLIFHSEFRIPDPTPPPATGVSCHLQQVVSGMGVFFVYEDGATNATHDIIRTNGEVVVTVPYKTKGGADVVLTNYICWIDIRDARIYVPDEQHGGISTYYLAEDHTWKPLTWGCELPDDMLPVYEGEVVIRFGEDLSDVRFVSYISLTMDEYLDIIGMLLNTDGGKKFAEKHPDYGNVDKFRDQTEKARKRKTGYIIASVAGGLVGGALGAGLVAGILGSGPAGVGVGLGAEAVLDNAMNILERLIEGANDLHGGGGGEGGQGGGGGGADPSKFEKIRKVIETALIMKDVWDTARALYEMISTRQYYRSRPYTDTELDYDSLLRRNRSDHGTNEKTGEWIVWVGAHDLPIVPGEKVENVFLCYDGSASLGDVFGALFFDKSSDHQKAYSIASDAATIYSLGSAFAAMRSIEGGLKARASVGVKSLWSTVLSLAMNLARNIVHYNKREGFFDVGINYSYCVGSGGNVCLQKMRFGCAEFSYDKWKNARTVPLMKVEKGGILEIKSTSFDGYVFAAGVAPTLIQVEDGGTLILRDAKITNCGSCPVVVKAGGQVWVSGNTKVDLQVADCNALRIGCGPRGGAVASAANLTDVISYHGPMQLDAAFATSAFASATGWNNVKASGYESRIYAEVKDGYAYWRMSNEMRQQLTPTFKADARFTIVPLPSQGVVRLQGTMSNAAKGFTYTLVGSPSVKGTYSPVANGSWSPGADGEQPFSIDVPCGKDKSRFFRVSVDLP